MQDTQRIVVGGLSEAEQATLDALVAQWRAKRPRNNLRAGYYDMKNATDHLLSADVPIAVRRRAFVLGWSAMAVDKLNRRCNLEPDGFHDANGADLGSLGLPELMRLNRLIPEMAQAGQSSLIHAVSWLVTTKGDESAGEPPVLVTARDATTATGFWDVRRRAMSSFLSLLDFNDRGEPTAMALYVPNLTITMRRDAGRWTVDRQEHSWGVPVDPLRYRQGLSRPFGRSRITRAVMSIHAQGLGAMRRADVNGEAYSLARYVLLGATEEAFKNADGSQKSTWQATWDAIWAIGDDDSAPDGLGRADVKQFQGQSPEPQNAHLRMLAQMFSGETGIPLGELGIIGDANPTSAEALSVAKEDLIAESEQTMDGWTPDLASAGRRALWMLNNGNIPADLDLRPHWRNPMYTSRAAAADAGMKLFTAMPWLAETEVGMEVAGLTADQITRATAERRRASGSEVLNALREAAQRVTDAEPA